MESSSQHLHLSICLSSYHRASHMAAPNPKGPSECLELGENRKYLTGSADGLNNGLNHRAFLVAQTVNSLPAVSENQVWSLGQEHPLEKEMATHSSILAWKIPGMEKPGGLQSMGSQRVRHDWVTNTQTSVNMEVIGIPLIFLVIEAAKYHPQGVVRGLTRVVNVWNSRLLK